MIALFVVASIILVMFICLNVSPDKQTKEQLTQVAHEKSMLARMLQRMKKERERQNNTIQQLQEEKSKLIKQIQTLNEVALQKENEISTLKQELETKCDAKCDALNDAIRKNERLDAKLREQIQTNNTTALQKENEISTLKEELETKSKELNDAIRNNERLEAKLYEQIQTNKKIDTQNKNEISKLKQELETKSKALFNTMHEKNLLEATLRKQKNELNRLLELGFQEEEEDEDTEEPQVHQIEIRDDEWAQKYNALKEKYDRLNKHKETIFTALQASLKNETDLQIEFNPLKKRYEALKKQYKVLRSTYLNFLNKNGLTQIEAEQHYNEVINLKVLIEELKEQLNQFKHAFTEEHIKSTSFDTPKETPTQGKSRKKYPTEEEARQKFKEIQSEIEKFNAILVTYQSLICNASTKESKTPQEQSKGSSNYPVIRPPISTTTQKPNLRDKIDHEASQLSDIIKMLSEWWKRLHGEEAKNSDLNKMQKALQKIIGVAHYIAPRNPSGRPGICSDCNKVIPSKRLDVLPYATRCIHCQGKWEKESARIRRAQDSASDFHPFW